MAQDNSFLFDIEEEKIDLRSIAYRYIRNWYLFVIFLVLAFIGAFFGSPINVMLSFVGYNDR